MKGLSLYHLVPDWNQVRFWSGKNPRHFLRLLRRLLNFLKMRKNYFLRFDMGILHFLYRLVYYRCPGWEACFFAQAHAEEYAVKAARKGEKLSLLDSGIPQMGQRHILRLL